MILFLPPEILHIMLKYLDDGQVRTLRLVNQALKVHCDSLYGHALFQSLSVDLGSLHKIRALPSMIEGSPFPQFLKYITIRATPDAGSFAAEHTNFEHTVMGDFSAGHRPSASRSVIHALHLAQAIVPRILADSQDSHQAGLNVWSLLQKSLTALQIASAPIQDISISNFFAGITRSWRSTGEPPGSMPAITHGQAATSTSELAIRHEIASSLLTTALLLAVWEQSTIRSSSIDLGQALIHINSIPLLVNIIGASSRLQRLSFCLFEAGSVGMASSAAEYTEPQDLAPLMAATLGTRLEELVISSVAIGAGHSLNNQFLSDLLEKARLPNLFYLSLEGFDISYTILLQFLIRHKQTITNHLYENVNFLEFEHATDDEFEDQFNRDLNHHQLPEIVVLIE